MKANHIPVQERLRQRIWGLELKLDRSHQPSPHRRQGNPYYHCTGCGLHDPQISISGHLKRCPYKGIPKEIEHYKRLLAQAG